MVMTHSSICILDDLVCMGCCGRDYTSREDVLLAIDKNTREFKACQDLQEFRDRPHSRYLRDCGVCRNVIFSDDDKTRVICPIHPKVANTSADLREGHCEVEYLCKAAFLFDLWDEKKQEAFISSLKKKDLDWWTFSMGMDDDSFVDGFEDHYHQLSQPVEQAPRVSFQKQRPKKTSKKT